MTSVALTSVALTSVVPICPRAGLYFVHWLTSTANCNLPRNGPIKYTPEDFLFRANLSPSFTLVRLLSLSVGGGVYTGGPKWSKYLILAQAG